MSKSTCEARGEGNGGFSSVVSKPSRARRSAQIFLNLWNLLQREIDHGGQTTLRRCGAKAASSGSGQLTYSPAPMSLDFWGALGGMGPRPVEQS